MTEPANIYEIIGFIGSVIVAVSLTMSSIVKLRWYNLVGASIFSIYGFLIGSMPVALLNLFITITDVYFLVSIYSKKEYFKALVLRPDNYYLEFFLEFYHNDILKYFPDFPAQRHVLKKETENPFALIILRDAAVAGVVLGKRSGQELKVILDYVIPQYRDLKPGKFLFQNHVELFREYSIKYIQASSNSSQHSTYLKKLGFEQQPGDGQKARFVKRVY